MLSISPLPQRTKLLTSTISRTTRALRQVRPVLIIVSIVYTKNTSSEATLLYLNTTQQRSAVLGIELTIYLNPRR